MNGLTSLSSNWIGCLHPDAAHAIDQFGKGRCGTPTVREQTTFYGETKRKHLPLPVLHIKI